MVAGRVDLEGAPVQRHHLHHVGEAAAVRVRRAAPYVISGVLAVVGAGLWARLIAHVVDYWDGVSLDRREDFVAFYAAAVMVRDGLGSAIYRPDVIARTEELLLGRPAGRVEGLAFMNPPFVAGMMQPLTLLPYGVAQAVWFAASALIVAASIALLWRDLRALRGRWAFAFAVAAIASFPVFMSLLYGQLSPLVLLAWVVSYRLGANGHAGWSGVALACALVKPQLAVVPVLYLIVTGRWRALAGFAGGAAALFGISAVLSGPWVTFVDYPSFLLGSLRWREEFGVNRLDMFGWHGFFIRQLPTALTEFRMPLTVALSAATLAAAIVVWRKRRSIDEMWAPVLAIGAATVLISPHIHTHDLLVLMLPAALVAAQRRDAFAVAAAGLLLFAAPMAMIRVNLATPMLAAALAVVVADVVRSDGAWSIHRLHR
jgi:glycosyl transferase family 87